MKPVLLHIPCKDYKEKLSKSTVLVLHVCNMDQNQKKGLGVLRSTLYTTAPYRALDPASGIMDFGMLSNDTTNVFPSIFPQYKK